MSKASEYLIKQAVGRFKSLIAMGAPRENVNQLVRNIRTMRRSGPALSHATSTVAPIQSKQLLSPILIPGGPPTSGGNDVSLMYHGLLPRTKGVSMIRDPKQFIEVGKQVEKTLPQDQKAYYMGAYKGTPMGGYSPELGQTFFGAGNAAINLSHEDSLTHRIYAPMQHLQNTLPGMKMDPMGGFVFGSTGPATASQPARLPLGGGKELASVPVDTYQSLIKQDPSFASWVAPKSVMRRYLNRPSNVAETMFETEESALRNRFGLAMRGYRDAGPGVL